MVNELTINTNDPPNFKSGMMNFMKEHLKIWSEGEDRNQIGKKVSLMELGDVNWSAIDNGEQSETD